MVSLILKIRLHLTLPYLNSVLYHKCEIHFPCQLFFRPGSYNFLSPNAAPLVTFAAAKIVAERIASLACGISAARPSSLRKVRKSSERAHYARVIATGGRSLGTGCGCESRSATSTTSARESQNCLVVFSDGKKSATPHTCRYR